MQAWPLSASLYRRSGHSGENSGAAQDKGLAVRVEGDCAFFVIRLDNHVGIVTTQVDTAPVMDCLQRIGAPLRFPIEALRIHSGIRLSFVSTQRKTRRHDAAGFLAQAARYQSRDLATTLPSVGSASRAMSSPREVLASALQRPSSNFTCFTFW